MSGKKLKFYFLACLFGLAVMVWLQVWRSQPSAYLKADFFDVGQGDSIFFETPDHRQILIDGGPSTAVLGKLGSAMGPWDRYLDVVVATHPDVDHISGLVDVLRRYDVGLIVYPDSSRTLGDWQEILKIIKEKNIPALAARSGQKIIFGDGPAFSVLMPPAGPAGDPADTNKLSVVAEMRFGSRSFLLAADAEAGEEAEILQKMGGDPKVDVLKVGHHGSKNSSSEYFLAALSPDVAVISDGKGNRYGHPNPSILDRLAKIGSRIMRTDELGDIRFVTDGSAMAVNSGSI